MNKFREGVCKMSEMTSNLNLLKESIAAMQPKLQESQSEMGQLMGMIQEEKAEVGCRVQGIHVHAQGLGWAASG